MEKFVQDETDEWNAGLTVPVERWPTEDDDAAKALYEDLIEKSGCPFAWLLDDVWETYLSS